MTTEQLTASITAEAVELRRRILSRYFHSLYDGKIQLGPLKGYVVDFDPKWGTGDGVSKMFGLYEQEVLMIVEGAAARRKTLVNLGAADGYYGIGLVATKVFSRSVCYESDVEARASLVERARTHGVSERVIILDRATGEFPSEIRNLGVSPNDALILCDIEGAEFEVFDAACLKALRGAEIVIELHEFMVPDGGNKVEALYQEACKHFDVRLFKTGFRDLSGISALDALSDSDRWLCCSEGRTKMMSWLHFTPR